MADLGCGSGHTTCLMAQAFPSSRFFGYDISDEAIESARAEAVRSQLGNVHFQVQDATTLSMLRDAGLTRVELRTLPEELLNQFDFARKPRA